MQGTVCLHKYWSQFPRAGAKGVLLALWLTILEGEHEFVGLEGTSKGHRTIWAVLQIDFT